MNDSEVAERLLMETEIKARAAEGRRELETLRRMLEEAEARFGPEEFGEQRERLRRFEAHVEDLEDFTPGDDPRP